MRWTHFLMAIYLLAVSFYPCTDSDLSVLPYKSVENSHNQDGHSHDDERHTCPPFCVCNCCGVQMLNYVSNTTFEFPIPFRSILLKESFYISNLSATYTGSIWQPPQRV